MSSQMKSHTIPLLFILSCLVMMAAPKRINCMIYVYHPSCRGISAKRSSLPYHEPSLSSSSSSSRSSFKPHGDSAVRATLIKEILQSIQSEANRLDDTPVNILQHQPQQPQQHQQPSQPRKVPDYDEYRRRLLQSSLTKLGLKALAPQDVYGYYSELDNDSS